MKRKGIFGKGISVAIATMMIIGLLDGCGNDSKESLTSSKKQ